MTRFALAFALACALVPSVAQACGNGSELCEWEGNPTPTTSRC